MKNVLTLVKLYANKDKKSMHKAGWLDDEGNLTETGKSVYLNYLLDKETNGKKEDLEGMGALARTVNKEKIDESGE